jgi:hypothetical protein
MSNHQLNIFEIPDDFEDIAPKESKKRNTKKIKNDDVPKVKTDNNTKMKTDNIPKIKKVVIDTSCAIKPQDKLTDDAEFHIRKVEELKLKYIEEELKNRAMVEKAKKEGKIILKDSSKSVAPKTYSSFTPCHAGEMQKNKEAAKRLGIPLKSNGWDDLEKPKQNRYEGAKLPEYYQDNNKTLNYDNIQPKKYSADYKFW